MRLWTLHPRYLDAKGLVALWREGLLAKAVLEGKTTGYRNHPQLIRFRAHVRPAAAIAEYQHSVLLEAQARGYRFDGSKLPARDPSVEPIEETQGQLNYEWGHLLGKLEQRDAQRYRQFSGIRQPDPHPLFILAQGDIQDWEKTR